MSQSLDHPLRLSIVVPVYRSEHILPKLVEEVVSVMRAEHLFDSFELVLVNDGSPDGSWEQIKKLAQSNAFIVGVSLMMNFGQHNATMAGLRHARGSTIVIMDDDLQHPPSAIGKLLKAIEGGADVTYVRYLHRKHSMDKKLASWFANLVATVLLSKPYDLYLSSFKALRREVANEIVKYDGPYAYIDGLILEVTRSITVLDIEHQPRYGGGRGNYNFARAFGLWMKMATSFSITPLRVAAFIGLVLSTVSFILIVLIIIVKYLKPATPAGWSSLAALILFVGGAQLTFIGLIGEYLGRTYLRINRKPQFVVREVTAPPTGPNSKPN